MALDLLDKTTNGNDLTNSGVSENITDTPFVESTISAEFVKIENDYLFASDSPTLSPTNDFTIEVWVKPASFDPSGMCVIAKDNDPLRSYEIQIDTSGLVAGLVWKTGGAQSLIVSNSTIPLDTWTHLVLSYHFVTDGTSRLRIYINGILDSEDNSGIGPVDDNNAEFWVGGRQRSGGELFFEGKIDEVRLWNTERTQPEIAGSMSSELVGTETGLVAYYPYELLHFEPSSGQPLEFLASHILTVYHFLRAGDNENYETTPTAEGLRAQILPAGTDIVVFYPDIPAYQLWDIFIFDQTTIQNGDKLVDEDNNEYIVKGVSFKVNEIYMTYQRIAGQKIT